MPLLGEDRLFPSDSRGKDLARAFYARVRDLPIIGPHGHTDPKWFAQNRSFGSSAELFVTPDHYVFRMLYSQGIRLEDLGIQTRAGAENPVEPREVWRIFAEHYYGCYQTNENSHQITGTA
ncbi:MAG: glucuronate isomerase [Rhodobacterales bacterium]|tara:strand:+ start:125 stop:487 length:363 start_codon:yes stop_codon:yes gene_type:complete